MTKKTRLTHHRRKLIIALLKPSNNDKQCDSKQQGGSLQHEQHQHCSKFIIDTLKVADHALTYQDFGETYDYGTLRNEMRKLAKDGEVLSPIHEWPKRFILREWAARREYAAVRRNDKRSTVGRFDFLSYLEGLDWSPTLAVHNLKFSFEAFQFPWLPTGWDYCTGNNSWSKSFDFSYAAKVQCFNTGSVVISVRCSARPIPLDLDGLLAISNLLGEVRYALHAPCVPEPMNWTVVNWHLNRDSEPLMGDGLDLHLTFRDLFGDAAQFYYKKQIDRMRAEVSQSPKQSVKEVFEKIIDRDNFGGGGKSDA